MQTFRVDRGVLPALARHLKSDPALDFKLLLDVCGVDYPGRDERFEVVYHAASLERGHRIRLKVPVREDDPVVPSVYGVWRAADWFEREAFDMFGIRFEGHPNLKRILCHQAFQGHALRKDYDPGQRWLLREAEQDEPAWAKEHPEDGDHFETQVLNLGPSHPATHGTLRTVVRLDGEIITKAEVEIGYLHRCFEKMAESHTWNQVIPYTDRLNYCSAMMNGVGYALAVENMLGVPAPPRAQTIRLILSELSRIMDHIVDIGANLNDLGAMTPFLYMYEAREEIYSLLEACCGSRLTMSYVRIGGLSARRAARFRGLGAVPPQAHPEAHRRHGDADHREPDLPRPHRGDRQALRRGRGGLGVDRAVPARQRRRRTTSARPTRTWATRRTTSRSRSPTAATRTRGTSCGSRRSSSRSRSWSRRWGGSQPGPIIVDDHNVALPPKEKVYTEMESLIWHFKLIMEGMKVPAGETYGFTEGANGELGYYIVSDGGGKPYRIKVRPPCFAIFQAYPHMLEGSTVSDAVAMLGSFNVIAGELDR